MNDRMTQPFGVYVRADEAGRITAINSDDFLADFSGWTKIDEGFGDRYHHAQGNYLPEPLTDDRGVYRWKLANGKVLPRTPEEMAADAAVPAAEPSDTALLMEIAADHEYRICLMEMGTGNMV